jgi:hypothetical protein
MWQLTQPITVEKHEPMTENQVNCAVNYQCRLQVSLTCEREALQEFITASQREKSTLTGMRDEEEATLIKEGRLVEMSSWVWDKKISREEMQEELTQLKQFIISRATSKTTRTAGRKLNN